MTKKKDGLPMKLKDIDFCDVNPREIENPKFEEIKDSIRNTGLQQSLVVTKRPGDDKFTLFYGGNTRLRILRELYEETGDKKFADLKVNYRPFVSVTNLIVNHMSDNESKGNMCFVDKAKAALSFRDYYEKEHGEKLSPSELTLSLNDSGWITRHHIVSLYIYTAENLIKVIPNCLNAGMGKPRIEEIRKYSSAIKTYAKFLGEDAITEEKSLSEWYDELNKSDDADLFNAETCFSRFAYRISHIIKKPLAEVETQLHHILSEGKPYDGTNDFIEAPAEPQTESEPTTTDEKINSAPATTQAKIDALQKAAEATLNNASQDTIDVPTSKVEHHVQQEKNPLLTQEDEFIRRLQYLILQSESEFYGVLEVSEQRPFFKINEEAFTRITASQTVRRIKGLSEQFILYRFLKIWVVYHRHIGGNYTDITLNEKGLLQALSLFHSFSLVDMFVSTCKISLNKPQNAMYHDANIVRISDEFTFLEKVMDQFYVQG